MLNLLPRPLVQNFQTTGAVPSQPLYRVKAELLPASRGGAGHSGGPGPGRPRKVLVQLTCSQTFVTSSSTRTLSLTPR